MKVVLLAGGLGSRLAEETSLKPKPMVEIGGRPILWHIMNIYSHYGLNDFVICLGYKGYYIKEYFANYALHNSNVDIDLAAGSVKMSRSVALPPWRISLVDTGDASMTGGRLRRVREYLAPDEPFCMTYGDGVADIDLKSLLAFHASHGLDATMTAVRPAARFGALELEGDLITRFVEKPLGEGGYINGGFFVLHPRVLDRIAGDETIFEQEPLQGLARDRQLAAFIHDGFWQPMDTLRDKNHLDALLQSRTAPWVVWSDYLAR